jgi:hypothetical protein
MSIPFKSLDAVTVDGAGVIHDLENVKVDHAIQVSSTGSPSGYDVSLQGSLDGINWITITSTGGSDPDKYSSNGDFPVRYVRANLSNLTGGTAPTVTALVASA